MQAKLRTTVAAMMLLAPMAATLVVQPAQAQTRVAAQPSITNMALNSDSGLQPGSTLRVQLYASANARSASITLGDSGVTIPLRQQSAGNYSGSYVVRRSDRIDPTQLITARLNVAGKTYSRQFNYPPAFQALAMGAAPASSMQIERFVMRPGGRVEPGRELRFRLVGTPGADAWLDIPGVITGVDLAEVRPGVYEGTYTVRRRDDPNAFPRAVATLRNGNQRTTAKVDVRGGGDDVAVQQPGGRDERAPSITDMTPANGERVGDRGRALISARLDDEGSGVDRDSVRLRLNGQDVSGDVRVSANDINYRADLNPGRYTAELTVRDRAGNTTTKAWTFDVVPGDRMGAAAAGPLALAVTSHRDNAVVDANGNLTIQGRTAPGANVRVQVESVANVAGLLGVSQPVADQTVQADRNGNFSVSLQPRGLPIPGTRYDVRLTATSGGQTAEERITLVQSRG